MSKIEPAPALKFSRPDEVAECWDGVYSAPGGLYEKLWACVGKYKAPPPEVSEEPCYGMDSVAAFWDDFSPEDQAKLNELAAANDALLGITSDD